MHFVTSAGALGDLCRCIGRILHFYFKTITIARISREYNSDVEVALNIHGVWGRCCQESSNNQHQQDGPGTGERFLCPD